MKRLSLIVLVLSFTFTAPVTAADKDRHFAAQGDIPCGAWVKGRKEEGSWPELVYISWITGYITAYNQQTPDVYSIRGSTGMESVYLWMDKYCQENPLGSLSSGMVLVTIELWPNRKRIHD